MAYADDVGPRRRAVQRVRRASPGSPSRSSRRSPATRWAAAASWPWPATGGSWPTTPSSASPRSSWASSRAPAARSGWPGWSARPAPRTSSSPAAWSTPTEALADRARRPGGARRRRCTTAAVALVARTSTGPAQALRAAKLAIDGGLDMDLAAGLAWESQLFAGLFATEDKREGMAAFVERRKPGLIPGGSLLCEQAWRRSWGDGEWASLDRGTRRRALALARCGRTGVRRDVHALRRARLPALRRGAHSDGRFPALRRAARAVRRVRRRGRRQAAAPARARRARPPARASPTASPASPAPSSTRAPVLVLGGRAPQFRWGAGSLQEIDHVPLVTPITKHAATVTATDDIPAARDRARSTAALTPHRGPVFLDLPLDVIFSAPRRRLPAAPAVPVLEPDPDEVAQAAALIAAAQRPVIIAGSDVYGGDARRGAARGRRGAAGAGVHQRHGPRRAAARAPARVRQGAAGPRSAGPTWWSWSARRWTSGSASATSARRRSCTSWTRRSQRAAHVTPPSRPPATCA